MQIEDRSPHLAARGRSRALVPGPVSGPGRHRNLTLQVAVAAILVVALSLPSCAARLTWRRTPVAPQPNADPRPFSAWNRSMRAQIAEVLVMSVVMFVCWRLCVFVVKPLIKDKPWMKAFARRNLDMVKASAAQSPTIADLLDDEKILRFIPTAYIYMCFIGVHHCTAALLVCPRLGILGDYFSTETALALVGHGALMEVAWEVMDIVKGVGDAVSQAAGPPSIGLLMLVGNLWHHAMAMSMVMLMNAYYIDVLAYARLVFDLQFAAGAGTLLNAYTQTLDVSTLSGLWQQTIASAIFLVIIVITRAIYYWVLIYELLKHFIAVDDFTSYMVGVAVGSVLMPTLGLAMVGDSWTRLSKYVGKLRERLCTPEGVPESPVTPLVRKRPESASLATAMWGPRRTSFQRGSHKQP